MGTQLYFAYGSNLNLDDWRARVREEAREGLVPLHKAVLPGYELAFDYHSQSRNGGALNVRPRHGRAVEGMVFAVTECAWAELDRKEGAPNCYERIPVLVLEPDGNEMEVITYQVCEERRLASGWMKPTDEYLDIVRAGYKHWKLDVTELEAAAKPQEVNV